ncbi:hypothetical protein BJV82DRAFT_43566 [Fennellomyces sp. T-0311]|nr:hypothetical protein BJV82DRAFT_43566 [Fennellomyces sp. T-0311]
MLHAEKKALCSPPPVITTTSTEPEQESEPHDSESILPTSTDYIFSDDGCSSDGNRSSLSSDDDGDYPNTTSQASPLADDMVPPLPHVNTTIPYTDNIDHTILKDIFHLMDMIKISRRHTLAKEFARRFRDAVFVPDKEDRRKVEAYLEKNDITWDEMLCTNPSWVLRRVRRVVPPPQELYPKVDKLFNDYGDVVCWKTKCKLFDDDT